MDTWHKSRHFFFFFLSVFGSLLVSLKYCFLSRSFDKTPIVDKMEGSRPVLQREFTQLGYMESILWVTDLGIR